MQPEYVDVPDVVQPDVGQPDDGQLDDGLGDDDYPPETDGQGGDGSQEGEDHVHDDETSGGGLEDNVIFLSPDQYGVVNSGTYLIDRVDQDSDGNDVAVLEALMGTSESGYTRTGDFAYVSPGYTTDLLAHLADDTLVGEYVDLSLIHI